MKTLVLTTVCNALIAIGSMATPIKKAAPATPVSIEQQLASRLTYPRALRANTENSIVVVQFRLDERNRVRDLKVFSTDPSLNDELIQQLNHQKLIPTEPVAYVEPVYTARLRFQAPAQKAQSTELIATR